MTVRRESARERVPREAYLACDDTDTLIPSRASRFTNDERRRTQQRIGDCSRSVHE